MQDNRTLDAGEEHSNSSSFKNIQWYPGHMAKAKRNMEKDLVLVDLIIQVLDARAPKSSYNPQLKQLAGNKPQVLVLNKTDLANEEITKKWLQIYQREGNFVCRMNAAQKKGLKDFFAAIEKASQPLMVKLAARGRLKRPVRAMIVGVPNSGKSTLINALAAQAVTKTGNKPGVTKGKQWIKTDQGIELLDTPGVLWPKFADYSIAFNLAVIGSISDLVLPLEEIAGRLALWLKNHDPGSLKDRYNLTILPETAEEIIESIGRKRGLLGAGGIVRIDDAALLFLQEFRNGKLGRYTLDEPRE